MTFQTARQPGSMPHQAAACPHRHVEVLQAGLQTTIQDFPGRVGYWAVGVPPSGPMDALSFRLANRLLRNEESAPGLEITLAGPQLRFHAALAICLTGARMDASLDGVRIPFWTVVPVRPGQTLRIGRPAGPGARAYLCVSGGFDVAPYLGSAATFALGGLGGHRGRALRTGDELPLCPDPLKAAAGAELPVPVRPIMTHDWEIGVLYGPHGAPDFFTEGDVEMFFSTSWTVHHNSDRTGVRLLGPKPRWARPDGGEAGLHPSNIHDNAYAVGSVDFTGDMPILLGPDGPSLGGFVCPAVVAGAELWKLGQLGPGDRVRFKALPPAEAEALRVSQAQELATLYPTRSRRPCRDPLPESAAPHRTPAQRERPEIATRRPGHRHLLIEYGPPRLDLGLRFRVHALHQHLERRKVDGFLDLTPGIRTLQVHFDPARVSLTQTLDLVASAEPDLPALREVSVPSRILHLPLSWEDEATLTAIRRYMQTVRADAPWCPSNTEFIRRVNGLASVDEVRQIVYDASYLVLGLGDVYLGAPVATPLDPRHRLVTTKYNPARTWTPQNAVGIGGAYLCIYGMEGPGGYQFVGRTTQVWRSSPASSVGEPPWLLRFFDQIRFYPVSGEELLSLREGFAAGKWRIPTERSTLVYAEYERFLQGIGDDAARFKEKQQRAFDAERERWSRGADARDDR